MLSAVRNGMHREKKPQKNQGVLQDTGGSQTESTMICLRLLLQEQMRILSAMRILCLVSRLRLRETDRLLACRISSTGMSLCVKEMGDRFGAPHVSTGSQTELIIAGRLIDASEKWITFVLGLGVLFPRPRSNSLYNSWDGRPFTVRSISS